MLVCDGRSCAYTVPWCSWHVKDGIIRCMPHAVYFFYKSPSFLSLFPRLCQQNNESEQFSRTHAHIVYIPVQHIQLLDVHIQILTYYCMFNFHLPLQLQMFLPYNFKLNTRLETCVFHMFPICILIPVEVRPGLGSVANLPEVRFLYGTGEKINRNQVANDLQ